MMVLWIRMIACNVVLEAIGLLHVLLFDQTPRISGGRQLHYKLSYTPKRLVETPRQARDV